MTRGEMAIRLTAQHFKQASRDITGRSRNKAICTARHVAMVVWLDVVGGNYSKAARRFGRDHTSVMYARDKVANTPELQAVAQMLIDEVNGN
jgi:chromosomal replication initiation ATPase DnaA